MHELIKKWRDEADTCEQEARSVNFRKIADSALLYLQYHKDLRKRDCLRQCADELEKEIEDYCRLSDVVLGLEKQ